ncbi:MAG: acyl-CoA dehydrogenase family protein [Pseudomonas sp.]|uniref:acyl-CoA dehydrogenase family protein n=1 Tax=Pseudomonas sp. TaxID=306 RepID=UPI0039825B68
MNLLPSSEQIEIVDTLRAFLSEQVPVARFRPPSPQIGNGDAMYWPQLAELGFLGVAISEEFGGIGLGAPEEMLVHREFGRYLVSPAVLGLTLGAQLAAACGAAEVVEQLLSGTTAVGLATARGQVHIGAESSGDFHLIDGLDAAWLLCCTEQGVALFKREQFSDNEQLVGMDNVLTLERATLRSAAPMLWLDGQESTLYQRALLLAAAYAQGMAEATRDMAVEYAKVREQFNKPIGSFQAIKHICADMAIRAESALCQVTMAALIMAEDKPGADYHVASAKLVATKAALENAAQNIQVHGAFGFTSEADAHLFLKRSHVLDQFAGDQRRQRQRLIEMPFPDAA